MFLQKLLHLKSVSCEVNSTIDSVLAWHPAAPGLILSIPKKIYLYAAEIYWRHCWEKWTEAAW